MGRAWRTTGTVERVVDATADQVYDLISDVTSTGELSTECRKVEWLPGGPQQPVVGARFRGHNRSRLARRSRVCEITEARPGRAFGFRTVPERFDPSRRDSTTWRYDLVPQGERTLVCHSYEIITLPLRPFMGLYGVLLPQHRDMRPAMRQTLDVLAADLAAGPFGPPTQGGGHPHDAVPVGRAWGRAAVRRDPARADGDEVRQQRQVRPEPTG